jgi:nucleoid DNA-binding protein
MSDDGANCSAFFQQIACKFLQKDLSKRLLMPNLTKNNLVKKISEKTGLTQQEVFSVVQLTLEGITEGLATGNNVELRNFGVFEVRLTKKRIGRNPKKPQETVEIPPRAIVKFTAGKIMRQRVLLRTEELHRAKAA